MVTVVCQRIFAGLSTWLKLLGHEYACSTQSHPLVIVDGRLQCIKQAAVQSILAIPDMRLATAGATTVHTARIDCTQDYRDKWAWPCTISVSDCVLGSESVGLRAAHVSGWVLGCESVGLQTAGVSRLC